MGPPPLAKTLMVIPWPSFVIDTSFLELMVRVPSGHVAHQLIKTDEVVLVKPTLIRHMEDFDATLEHKNRTSKAAFINKGQWSRQGCNSKDFTQI